MLLGRIEKAPRDRADRRCYWEVKDMLKSYKYRYRYIYRKLLFYGKHGKINSARVKLQTLPFNTNNIFRYANYDTIISVVSQAR